MKRTILLIVLLAAILAVSAQAQETTPTPDPSALLSTREMEALPILINARNDIELLADQVYGASSRPEGWMSDVDVNDPQLPVFMRLNLEVLAGSVFGIDQRPPAWFGTVFSTPLAIARDVRHDLELVADTVVSAATIRPAGWQGADATLRCDRETQALITLLTRAGFVLSVDFSQPDACAQASLAASVYAEQNLIQPQVGGENTDATPAANSGAFAPFQVDTTYVVAFYDSHARRRAGVLPVGTGFTPVGRSLADFSNMMLVRGENFQIFVDYTTTPVSDEEYYALPEAGSTTDCSAEWCE